MMRYPSLFAAISLSLFTTFAMAAHPDSARNLAATCANCHGTNGQAVAGSGFESLAGMPANQMLNKLTEFRNGTRPATIMPQIAKGYSDAQLNQIAAYFAAKK